MSGIVGILANDSARFSLFTICVDRLQLPDGWRKEYLVGGDWCGARNTLVQMTLESEAEWLFYMDDDHAFSPDLLLKLLRHDLPLVTPLCLTRSAPFEPVSFTGEFDADFNRERLVLRDQPADGLVELKSGGSAGMLIHREVLEAIDPPWFEHSIVSEDLLFCDKAVAAGFSLHCDLSAKIGHITPAVIWPEFDEDWCVAVDVGSIGQMTRVLLPIAEKEEPCLAR
jgi:hypothetical protein